MKTESRSQKAVGAQCVCPRIQNPESGIQNSESRRWKMEEGRGKKQETGIWGMDGGVWKKQQPPPCVVQSPCSIVHVLSSFFVHVFGRGNRVPTVLFCILTSVFWILFFSPAFANNVTVSNVSLVNKQVGDGTVDVQFTLTQENTFSGVDDNGQTFYDRVWIFVKYWDADVDDETTGWHHATLVSGGTASPTSDGLGAFCQPGIDQTLRWSFTSNGVPAGDSVKVTVCAIEMVYIPDGSFVYNAANDGGSTDNNYGNNSQQNVTGPVTQTGDGTDTTHGPNGCAVAWPNGYRAFWVGKYEVSQGQYADFLNMLSAATASARFPNNNGNYRHTISYTGANPYGSRYAAGSPNRGCNYLSWDDCRAYLSWCGLRPLTEMEFEKAARGGGLANTRIYPWGDTVPSATTYSFDGATISQYYINYNNTSNGPVDVGHYLSGDIVRSNEQTGASVYGVTDLSGNNWELLINCSHLNVPAHGDGTASWPANWPSAASGKGLRGGSWGDSAVSERTSGRIYAGWAGADRGEDVGARGARTW